MTKLLRLLRAGRGACTRRVIFTRVLLTMIIIRVINVLAMTDLSRTYTAFAGTRMIASGDLRAVIAKSKELADRGKADDVLLFDDETGRQLEVSLEGTLDDVLARMLPAPPPPRRGRPKLGVVAREVTLLPRHWEWLERQSHGVSATLRRLVDEARKREPDEQRKRSARDAAYWFMTAMAGNRPGYEEALRSLYAKDEKEFEKRIQRWPADVRGYAARLAKPSF